MHSVLLTVLMVLGVLAVLFASAALATHDRALLVDASADRADVDLPVVGLQPEDISSVRLGMALRGYRMSEVDDVLARVAGELQSKDARILELEAALIEVVEPQVTAAEIFTEDPPVSPPRWPEPELEPEPDPEPILTLDVVTQSVPDRPAVEVSQLEQPGAVQPAPMDQGPFTSSPRESAATSIAVPHLGAFVPVGHPDSHHPTPDPHDPEPQPTAVQDQALSAGGDEEPDRD